VLLPPPTATNLNIPTPTPQPQQANPFNPSISLDYISQLTTEKVNSEMNRANALTALGRAVNALNTVLARKPIIDSNIANLQNFLSNAAPQLTANINNRS